MAPSMASNGAENQTIRPSPSSFTIRASGRASVIPLIMCVWCSRTRSAATSPSVSVYSVKPTRSVKRTAPTRLSAAGPGLPVKVR